MHIARLNASGEERCILHEFRPLRRAAAYCMTASEEERCILHDFRPLRRRSAYCMTLGL